MIGGLLQTGMIAAWLTKRVDGGQLTMAWHMDDMKVSHEKEEVLDEFIGMMEKEFGQDAPLSVS